MAEQLLENYVSTLRKVEASTLTIYSRSYLVTYFKALVKMDRKKDLDEQARKLFNEMHGCLEEEGLKAKMKLYWLFIECLRDADAPDTRRMFALKAIEEIRNYESNYLDFWKETMVLLLTEILAI